MRRLILTMQVTLDGFVGGPNGEVDWAFPGFDAEFVEWQVAKRPAAFPGACQADPL